MSIHPVTVEVIASSIRAAASAFGTVVPSSLLGGSVISLDMLREVTLVLVPFATLAACYWARYFALFSSTRESA